MSVETIASTSMNNLDESRVPNHPIELLRDWFDEARRSGNPVPDAMALATSDLAGRPSVRFVLLKAIEDQGLVFFTNYESRKAVQIAANPWAAAAIFWHEPRRQVRVEGSVAKLSPEDSDSYFRTRDRGNQIAAWASPQDRVLSDRAVLEARFADLSEQYAHREVPRPPFWGGYRIEPAMVEFWSGRESRLHDRVRYSAKDSGGWKIERLAP